MLRPDPDAKRLALFMADATDIHRDIIEETLNSAEGGRLTESGRTVCPGAGNQIRGPLGRFPRSVELASCSAGWSGIMHSHVSVDQLMNPEHSLPDTANVLFGNVGVSMVVGVDSHEILITPGDPEAAREVFSDVLGLPVRDTGDVVNALQQGHIPNPPDARRRLRMEMEPLFARLPSRLGEYEPMLRNLNGTGAIPAHAVHGPGGDDHSLSYTLVPAKTSALSATCRSVRARRATLASATSDGVDYRSLVIASVVGSVVSAFISSRL